MSDRPGVLALGDRVQSVAPSAWLAPDVTLTGDVRVHSDASLWFGVIARGDVEPIEIGEGSNVQDAAVLHTDPGEPLVIEPDVAIGHRAIVHGCRIETGALIGMGAIVLSGAFVGAGAVIGAGAVVREGAEVPPGQLAVGVPAKVVGKAPDGLAVAACERYRKRASEYRRSGIGS